MIVCNITFQLNDFKFYLHSNSLNYSWSIDFFVNICQLHDVIILYVGQNNIFSLVLIVLFCEVVFLHQRTAIISMLDVIFNAGFFYYFSPNLKKFFFLHFIFNFDSSFSVSLKVLCDMLMLLLFLIYLWYVLKYNCNFDICLSVSHKYGIIFCILFNFDFWNFLSYSLPSEIICLFSV